MQSSHNCSGTVSGAIASGVTINLTGSATASTTTDGSGNYSFSINNGNYTLTPSLTGYTFTPSNLSVTMSGNDSSGHNFTSVLLLTITSFEPTGGIIGTEVVITGIGFGTNATVKFCDRDDILAKSHVHKNARIKSCVDNEITVYVPSYAKTGVITITVGEESVDTSEEFTTPWIEITSFSPTSGIEDDEVVISGSGFSANYDPLTAFYNNISALIDSYTDTEIITHVPNGVVTGKIAIMIPNKALEEYEDEEGLDSIVIDGGVYSELVTTTRDLEDGENSMLGIESGSFIFPAPTFSLADGYYYYPQFPLNVVISHVHSGVDIYYTIDGTNPTDLSTLYSGFADVPAFTLGSQSYGTNICTGGVATDSYHYYSYPPSYAFDGNISTFVDFNTGWSNPSWIEYALAGGIAKIAAQYTILWSFCGNGYPTAWLFQGSTDDINWDTLDSQTGQSFANGETKTYNSFLNSIAYSYYRWYITAVSDNDSYVINELEIMELEGSPSQTIGSIQYLKAVASYGGFLSQVGTLTIMNGGYSVATLIDERNILVSDDETFDSIVIDGGNFYGVVVTTRDVIEEKNETFNSITIDSGRFWDPTIE